MKKLIKGAVLLTLILVVNGCGSTNKGNEKTTLQTQTSQEVDTLPIVPQIPGLDTPPAFPQIKDNT